MRAILSEHVFRLDLLGKAIVLDLIYALGAAGLFLFFLRSRIESSNYPLLACKIGSGKSKDGSENISEEELASPGFHRVPVPRLSGPPSRMRIMN